MKDFFTELLQSRYINSFIILLLFLLVAKFLDIFIHKVLKRLAKHTKFTIDDEILNILHRPVFYTIILFGVLKSVSILTSDSQTLYYARGISYTALSILWGVSISRIIDVILKNIIKEKADLSGVLNDFVLLLENISKVVLVIIVLMIILSAWEISITPLIASAGIAGAAVAFAAKDTIANFFGGLSIIVDKPYKKGDYIILENGERGEVVDIGIRSSRLKTRDDIQITIPNSYMANTKIVNESAPVPNFRVRLPIGVSYDSDLERVEDILMKITQAAENVIHEPVPRIRYRRFGDSAVELELLCWIDFPENRGRTLHNLIKTIHKVFKEEKVLIPFPQRHVHLVKKTE